MSGIVTFYTAKGPRGYLSNFSTHGFVLDDLYWPTVEHFFQAQKYPGTPYMERVRQARGPGHAKGLGRRRDWPLRPDWDAVRVDVMRTALMHKFLTHADICAALLATGERELVENAPADYFWGCGADGSGRNMLGKLLMEVRAALRTETNGESEPERSG